MNESSKQRREIRAADPSIGRNYCKHDTDSVCGHIGRVISDGSGLAVVTHVHMVQQQLIIENIACIFLN